MKVTIAESVQIALRNLSDDERRKVWAWIDNLKNWETDPFVRDRSRKLDMPEDVYVLKTSTDIWVFFALGSDSITVVDIAKKATIMSFGQASGSR